jgi:hypothetical protein
MLLCTSVWGMQPAIYIQVKECMPGIHLHGVIQLSPWVLSRQALQGRDSATASWHTTMHSQDQLMRGPDAFMPPQAPARALHCCYIEQQNTEH